MSQPPKYHSLEKVGPDSINLKVDEVIQECRKNVENSLKLAKMLARECQSDAKCGSCPRGEINNCNDVKGMVDFFLANLIGRIYEFINDNRCKIGNSEFNRDFLPWVKLNIRENIREIVKDTGAVWIPAFLNSNTENS